MPERRQRITSKVPVDKVKGVKTNEKSQFEEKSEEDEPDGEASIKKFIEISCYKLRNLMVANLLNRSLEGMDEVKNKTRKYAANSSNNSHMKTGDSDLVVLSVVLNKKQKENDEVSLAIERLRKNGVSCVFFTMDDIKNENAKPDGKLTNGFTSHIPKTCGIVNGNSDPIVVNPSSFVEREPELTTTTSVDKASPALTSIAAKSNINTDLNTHAIVPVAVPDHLPADSHVNSKDSSDVKSKNHTTTNSAASKRTKRKAKRKLNTQKLTSKSNLVVNCEKVPLRRGRPRKEIANVAHLDIISSPLDLTTVTTNQLNGVLASKEKSFTNLERNSRDFSTSSTTSSVCLDSRSPLVVVSSKNVNNLLNVKIPLVKTVVVKNEERKIVNTLKLIRNSKPQKNLKALKVAPPAAKSRKKIKEVKAPMDQSLAKFCLGDRATKSIAAERIKRCFTEETKKQKHTKFTQIKRQEPLVKFTQIKCQEPLVIDPTRSRENLRRLVNTKVQITEESTNNKMKVVSEIPSDSQETSNSSDNKGGTNTSTRKRVRPLSPDITFSYAKFRIQNSSKKSKSTKKRDLALSPDIAAFSQDKKLITSHSIEPHFERSYHYEQNNILPTPPTAEVAEDDVNGIKEILADLIDKVALELETNEITGQNKEASENLIGSETSNIEEKDVNATLPGLSAEKLEQSKISPKDVPSYGEDSLPDSDVMQLRRSSFYSLISGNVRTNMENYLDGRKPENSFILPSKRRRRVARNGFLLHHGDNCPDDPESPYKFHLATQVLLKFNRRRSKLTPKEERTKNLLSYLKLSPKRSIRIGKGHINKNSNTKCPEIHKSEPKQDSSTFSGDWTLSRKYICGVCSQVEYSFWDMVTHKGEHPGVVVTHVELPVTQEPPASLVRKGPSLENAQIPFISQACTKCAATFNSPSDLHRHMFECAGNSSWLVEKTTSKKKSRRRRGFKRRLSNTPKKSKKPETCKRTTCHTCYTCAFCGREFKTEGWLKNHVSTHSLPVSIPLDKLLFPLPVRASTRKCR